MHTTRRLNPLRELSAGEIAFDRCLLLVALNLGYGGISHFLLLPLLQMMTLERLSQVLLPFAFGVVLVFFWVRAFCRVVESWSDPVVCILRFCSLVVLAGQALVVCGLFLDSLTNLVRLLTSH